MKRDKERQGEFVTHQSARSSAFRGGSSRRSGLRRAGTQVPQRVPVLSW